MEYLLGNFNEATLWKGGKYLSEADLRSVLDAANARLHRAIEALAPKHKGGEVEEYAAAHDAVLAAERSLAAARGEAYAVPIEFPVQWDTGAPLPHLVQNDYKTFLIFLLADISADWNGSSVTIVNSRVTTDLAVVEFVACRSAKMGAPNDEVYQGHPLYGKGFVGYRPLKVENSPWIRELEGINSVHVQYDPARWQALNHYVFGFHDCTFECVAESFSVETTASSIRAALAAVCERL